ncbi:hypothetical protein [uncultured Methanomethylovorans sp.]|uniref:hypothetical protein n=1 Tax=uncultured Methanomethylovorans sp. TaxID=183759 RepID=UPI002AA91F9F|nr:hypothetical protein [uncultured Methanomethylovorans sp.]
MKNKYLKNIIYGFLSWLIPFVASLFFYTKEGVLIVDIFLFKSIMIVVGSISAGFLLVSYFKNINAEYYKEGIVVGFTWFAINILLDLLILVQMSGMSITDYFSQIGLRYIVIPVMTITIGAALKNKK